LAACGSSPDRPHFFFRPTEKSKNVGCLRLPGVFEARFVNQYVVGPGSLHPEGVTYRWLNDEPIIPIPDWLVSGLAHLALTQSSRRNPTIERGADGKIGEGGRHYALMSEAGRLWDGNISEEELTETLLQFNQEYCEPPKDEAHVRQCVRDVMKLDPYDPGPKVVINAASTKEVSAPFKYPKVPGRTRDYILSPVHTPFDGWFPKGRVSIVGGSSGAGKTTFILDALNRQANAGSVLGHAGTESPYLVIFADRTELSNRETLERMGLDSFTTPISYLPVCWDGDAVNGILERIEAANCPAAVFIEGADALVRDANKAQVVAPFLAGLQKIAEHYHIALILSCGAPKQKPKDQYAQTRDRIFGSQMWGRMCEDILTITSDQEVPDLRNLTVEHRNARREKFVLEFKDGLLVEAPRGSELEG